VLLKERCSADFVGERSSQKKEKREHEAHAHPCYDGPCVWTWPCGLRDQAAATAAAGQLSGWNHGPGRLDLPGAAAAASAAGHLPGWIDASGRLDLPAAAASATSAAAKARGRTRLSCRASVP